MGSRLGSFERRGFVHAHRAHERRRTNVPFVCSSRLAGSRVDLLACSRARSAKSMAIPRHRLDVRVRRRFMRATNPDVRGLRRLEVFRRTRRTPDDELGSVLRARHVERTDVELRRVCRNRESSRCRAVEEPCPKSTRLHALEQCALVNAAQGARSFVVAALLDEVGVQDLHVTALAHRCIVPNRNVADLGDR